MISDQSFLNWQKKLKERKLYRRFWRFWAIDSIWLVFLVGLYFLFTGQIRVDILALCAFVFVRFVVSPLIYFFYKKQRPYQSLNFETIYSRLLSAATKKANSFPSDHAISLAAIAMVFGYFSLAMGLVVAAIAIFNGAARIILGYHYFADVLAGWFLGVLSALIVVYWLGPVLFTR